MGFMYGSSNAKLKHKGALCSTNGSAYEKAVHCIVKNCKINGVPFNSQEEKDLAGSSSKNDITCTISSYDIGVEVKKYNTPDWMQCSIKYIDTDKRWISSNGKNSESCQRIFNSLINDVKLYNGDIPPFMEKSITHEEWINIKNQTDKWKDMYINIPSDTIRRLYSEKGCYYIQISDGFGLYHLGRDICGFGVPLFDIEQQLRIRTKIHSRKNKKGFCSLSVTAACQPKNIKSLSQSPFSLDKIDKLPHILVHSYT